MSKREDYLTFGAPLIKQEEIDEVVDSLESGWIGTGPKVMEFQEMVKEYTGTDHALAVNSCTAALHLSLLVSDLDEGAEVITTPLTFCATANAILHAGYKPVFVDVDRETQLMKPEQIEQAVTDKTGAILPVHLHGRPCDMDAILDIADRRQLLVIEDAAHAIGARYRDQKIGSIGDLTCFSFYVTKNVCTGEGGMVTTDHQEYANRIKRYALHGMSKGAWERYSDEEYNHYTVDFPGYKYNMMDLQAALGLHQFPRLEQWQQRRDEIWFRYQEAFEDLPITLPPEDESGIRHARHLYTIMVDEERCGIERDQFVREMDERNIGTGVHYIGLHLHPYYSNRFGFEPDDFPNATWISRRTVSLPLSPALSEKDVNDVINAVHDIIS